ncbi:MAG: hypothetical protein DRR42_24420 [Gammaproteobacteria bacterium]|nr:MAG: hypothetical protein DRR42_24420 [Gammaproteobacteria bacterium]
MALTLADLLRDHWESYTRENFSKICTAHRRAVRNVLTCRTSFLGGMVFRCTGCRKNHYAYHSCNHRNCPQCGALDQQIWSAKQEARLLPVPYFMVTFTIPSELRSLCLAYPKELYGLMLKASASALKDVVATKTKGGRCGFTSVLHTWGRQLQLHPHIHCIVPAAAFLEGNQKVIIPGKGDFLIHYLPLAARFRSLMWSRLKNDYPEIYQNLTSDQLRSLSARTPWNVNLRHVGSGCTALRYLARYVKRSGFTAKRLVGYDAKGMVMLRWTCSTTNKTSIIKLTPHEFIRRWLLHALPKGFARIRHYGFLSGAAKKTRLRVRAYFGEMSEPLPKLPEKQPFTCPHCYGELRFLRLIKRDCQDRGPP